MASPLNPGTQLDSLNGRQIGNDQLTVEYLGRPRFFDQLNFALYLYNSNDNPRMIFRGLYNIGRPSIHVPGWIDGEFVENVSGDEKNAGALYVEVAQALGELIPSGGRMWLAYESFGDEGALMRETRAGIAAAVPLVTTPLGVVLYRAGCWLGLRDWHFPEGGREGPRKLQGNKAVNAAHAQLRAKEVAAELENFLQTNAQDDLVASAQARARIVLPAMNLILG